MLAYFPKCRSMAAASKHLSRLRPSNDERKSSDWRMSVTREAACGATTCDATARPANKSVQTRACAVCPAGTTNAAGDDASGGNTNCDAVSCAEDEFVRSNACVPCPAGTKEAADDDAPGARSKALIGLMPKAKVSATHDSRSKASRFVQERPETYSRRLTVCVEPENMEEPYEEVPSPLPSPRDE